MALVPLQPIVQPGESPLSVIRRTAAANYRASPLTFAYSLGCGLDHSVSALKAAVRNDDLLAEIFSRCGVSRSQAEQIWYSRTGRGRLDAYRWNGLDVPLRDLCLARSKVCISCYIELGYSLSAWDHVAALACQRHQVLLEHACPCCGDSWTWNSFPMQCRCPIEAMIDRQVACGDGVANLLSHAVAHRDQERLNLISSAWHCVTAWSRFLLGMTRIESANAVASIVDGRWPAQSGRRNECQIHPRVLLGNLLAWKGSAAGELVQSLLSQPETSAMYGARIDGEITKARAEMLLGVGRLTLSRLARSELISTGAGGRIDLQSVNDLLNVAAGNVDGARSRVPLSTLRAGRHRQNMAGVLCGIRSGDITNFHCPPADGLSGLSCAPCDLQEPSRKGVSLGTLATEAQTNYESIRKLVLNGLIQATRGSASSPVEWVVSREEADRFLTTYEFSSAIASRFAAPRNAVAGRLRGKGLDPVSGPNVDGGLTYLFRRSDLSQLDLGSVVNPENESSPAWNRRDKPRSLRKASLGSAEVARKLGVSVRQVREVVAQGWLKPAKHDGLFRRSEVDQLMNRLREDYVEVESAAARLNQSIAQFRKTWVETRLIAVRRYVDQQLVPGNDLERIQSLWASMGTSSDIGRSLGRGRWLCQNLKKMNELDAARSLGVGTRRVDLFRRDAPQLRTYDLN